MAVEHWLRLAMTDGIGPILIGRVIEAAGMPRPPAGRRSALLQTVEGIGTSKATAIHRSMREASVDDVAGRNATSLACRSSAPTMKPTRRCSKEIPDPPAVLYVKGSFEARDLNAVAIVGSRKCRATMDASNPNVAALLAVRGFHGDLWRGAKELIVRPPRCDVHPHGRTIAVLGAAGLTCLIRRRTLRSSK